MDLDDFTGKTVFEFNLPLHFVTTNVWMQTFGTWFLIGLKSQIILMLGLFLVEMDLSWFKGLIGSAIFDQEKAAKMARQMHFLAQKGSSDEVSVCVK